MDKIIKQARARKAAALDLFQTLREETRRPASKRRQKNLVHATALAALLYLEARNDVKKNENKAKSIKRSEKE